MRILIAAKHPPGGSRPIGGVQSWSATVGQEFRRHGHIVEYWGPEFSRPRGAFDLGILANLRCTAEVGPLCQRVLRVSHGIVEDEQGGPGFCATSEEVKAHWKCDGPVVRQPIDLDFWSPDPLARPVYLTRFSYRNGLGFLREIAPDFGLEYVQISNLSATAARTLLRHSAVVVASGRAAVEAMACGVPVVLADHRPYQGALLFDDPAAAMKRNYSGRGGSVPTWGSMRDALARALDRGSLRAHTEKHHDVRQIIGELVCSLC